MYAFTLLPKRTIMNNVISSPSHTVEIDVSTGVGGKLYVKGPTDIGRPGQEDPLILNAELQGANPIILEGATKDSNELTLAVADPTQDRVQTFPDATGVRPSCLSFRSR